jgi:formylglycine-generating enzyme required for sulfatase activity
VRSVWEVELAVNGSASARNMPLPELPAWQRSERFEARAVSAPGVVPAGYLTYYLAKRACDNAGKRLCTEDEWVGACRGARDLPYPYGGNYVAGRCNVFRAIHPASVLHDNASMGHTDPRLNLVLENGTDPLLRLTGATPGCESVWGDERIYDMVGNLDEWIADEKGVFVGGFYSRGTSKGCEARISSHAPVYYDYSTGTRCCRDAQASARASSSATSR